MNNELTSFFAILALLAFWVIIPMIPAIIIYKFFPDTIVAAEGPFANLTIKSTGAFAGYLLIFASTYILIEKGVKIIGSFQKSYWTISGTVVLENDYQLNSVILEKLEVSTDPAPFVISKDKIKLYVPEIDNIPFINFAIPTFGYTVVDLNDKTTKIIKDEFKKEIRIEDVITIKQNAETWKNEIEKPQQNRLKSNVPLQ